MRGKSIRDLEDECSKTNERETLWEHMNGCFDFQFFLIDQLSFPWKEAKSGFAIEKTGTVPRRRRHRRLSLKNEREVKEAESNNGSLLTGSLDVSRGQRLVELEVWTAR